MRAALMLVIYAKLYVVWLTPKWVGIYAQVWSVVKSLVEVSSIVMVEKYCLLNTTKVGGVQEGVLKRVARK